MNGKVVGCAILVSGVIAGIGLYYAQEFAFYHDVNSQDVEVQLVSSNGASPTVIEVENMQATDSESSPIRFRACFTTSAKPALLAESHLAFDNAVPRNAPRRFECFDAAAIGTELASGQAMAFLGQKNVKYGVDRVVAITENGRGYIWHEFNDCGEKAYDGTIVGEECPRRDEN